MDAFGHRETERQIQQAKDAVSAAKLGQLGKLLNELTGRIHTMQTFDDLVDAIGKIEDASLDGQAQEIMFKQVDSQAATIFYEKIAEFTQKQSFSDLDELLTFADKEFPFHNDEMRKHIVGMIREKRDSFII